VVCAADAVTKNNRMNGRQFFLLKNQLRILYRNKLLKSCQFVKKGWLIAAVPNSMVGGIKGINTPFLLKVNEGKAGNRVSGFGIIILNE
jgi:hypothetical protein